MSSHEDGAETAPFPAAGAWSKLHDFGPPRRSAHVITYDSDRTRILLFGGEADPNDPHDYFGDTWETPAGPIAENLIVQPNTVNLLLTGVATTYEFDIPRRGLETSYAVFLESRGKRALLESSTTATSVAHVSRRCLRSVISLLHSS